MMSAAWQQELQRQQALVQALFAAQPSAEPDARLQAWEQGATWQAGLAAYRGNGLEHARAALRTLWHHLHNPRLRAACAVGFCVLFSLVGTFTYVNFLLAAPPFNFSPASLANVFLRNQAH